VLILKEMAVGGDRRCCPSRARGLPYLGQWMGAFVGDCPFDLAQGKQAERLAQPTERMGPREWVGSWRKLERLDRGTVVRCELEEGRDEKKRGGKRGTLGHGMGTKRGLS
jgi:hypothetical protein